MVRAYNLEEVNMPIIKQCKTCGKDFKTIPSEVKKGVIQKKLAKLFNINQSEVSRIVNNIRWISS